MGQDGDPSVPLEQGRHQGPAGQARRPSDEDLSVGPRVAVRRGYHRFHGALARHAVSRASWSATVSMHCQ